PQIEDSLRAGSEAIGGFLDGDALVQFEELNMVRLLAIVDEVDPGGTLLDRVGHLERVGALALARSHWQHGRSGGSFVTCLDQGRSHQAQCHEYAAGSVRSRGCWFSSHTTTLRQRCRARHPPSGG